jgi:hypothetical protein
MSRFDCDWLELREPHDRRARARSLERRLRTWRAGMNELSAIDLGCGTGANFRRLAPRLGGAQRWLLLDNDPAMLAATPKHLARWAARRGYEFRLQKDGALRIRGRGLDCRLLVRRCELAREATLSLSPGYRLITCSALLDLVSEAWIQAVTRYCRLQCQAVLWALSYDGRIRFGPPLATDHLVRRLVNQHQRGDKGLGPALGPGAACVAQAALENAGYDTWVSRSDWQLGTRARAVQLALLEGWANAGRELDPAHTPALSRWLRQRRQAIAAGRSRLRVGHLDVLGMPPTRE